MEEVDGSNPSRSTIIQKQLSAPSAVSIRAAEPNPSHILSGSSLIAFPRLDLHQVIEHLIYLLSLSLSV
jgi:hypothetical protein